MARYIFDRWEDGSTSPTRTLVVTSDLAITAYYVPVMRNVTYNSSPINVPCTINGMPIQPGQTAQVEDGATITIAAPAEVEA